MRVHHSASEKMLHFTSKTFPLHGTFVVIMFFSARSFISDGLIEEETRYSLSPMPFFCLTAMNPCPSNETQNENVLLDEGAARFRLSSIVCT